jgi:hypothetical protein
MSTLIESTLYGSNLTVESTTGFPTGLGRATLRPGVTIALSGVDGPPPGGDRPQRLSEACLAGRDRAALGGRPRHGRDQAPDGQVQDLRLGWQERSAEERVDGLLSDKTRPSRVAPLGQEVIDGVVALTATEPPHEDGTPVAEVCPKAGSVTRHSTIGARSTRG